MSDDLFPSAVSLSPKLAWLARHGLVLRRTERGKYECVLADDVATGDSEEEACVEFCVMTRLTHWNEE